MTKRSRAHEAGSVEAGSSISKSIFFANRVVRAVVGAFACTQIEPTRAHRSAQGSQIEPARVPRSAQLSQIEPARAPRSTLGSQIKPARATRSVQGSQIEPARAPRSAQGTQIEAARATLTKHCPCAAKSTKILPMRSRIDAQEWPGQANRGGQGTKSRSRRADRASQGAQGSQIEPVEARSSHPGRARSLGWSPRASAHARSLGIVGKFRY